MLIPISAIIGTATAAISVKIAIAIKSPTRLFNWRTEIDALIMATSAMHGGKKHTQKDQYQEGLTTPGQSRAFSLIAKSDSSPLLGGK